MKSRGPELEKKIIPDIPNFAKKKNLERIHTDFLSLKTTDSDVPKRVLVPFIKSLNNEVDKVKDVM